MNRYLSRRPFALVSAPVGGFLALAALILLSLARTAAAAEPRWSVVLTTAPHAPQDVWFVTEGNNTDGWRGGGCLCLGGLAQGLGPGDHATILINVIEGGVFGVDGTPVPAGTYTAPGAIPFRDRTGPGAELEEREFEMEEGRTFYLIVEAYIVESNIPELPPAGSTLSSMFTFDFDPNHLGRTENLAVNWFDFGFGFFPFLNEGLLMTNVRRLR
jgi:hypothetical protein